MPVLRPLLFAASLSVSCLYAKPTENIKLRVRTDFCTKNIVFHPVASAGVQITNLSKAHASSMIAGGEFIINKFAPNAPITQKKIEQILRIRPAQITKLSAPITSPVRVPLEANAVVVRQRVSIKMVSSAKIRFIFTKPPHFIFCANRTDVFILSVSCLYAKPTENIKTAIFPHHC